MKARLIKQNNKMLLLLSNGTIANVDEGVLRKLFIYFKDLSCIQGKDGRWDTQAQTMDLFKGRTLAWVDDKDILCIKENPFLSFVQTVADEEYITLHEYAELHKVTDNRIKVLSRDGRLNGAIKKAGKWFIPKNTPYPQDARYKGND